jgi:hypothetical protein
VKLIAFLAGLHALLLTPVTAHAADYRRVSIAVGGEYTSGKYGGTNSTEIRYVPVSLRYQLNDTGFRVTVPYLSITTTGFVETESGVVGTGGAQTTTESGLGDVIGAVTQTVVSDSSNKLFVDVTGKVKFPTADANAGLGTGKADYMAQVGIWKDFDRIATFGGAGYKFVGSPAGVALRNVLSGYVGASYKLTPATSASLIADVGQSTIAGRETKRLVTGELAYRVTDSLRIRAYLLKGFSASSPDYGGGFILSYSWGGRE